MCELSGRKLLWVLPEEALAAQRSSCPVAVQGRCGKMKVFLSALSVVTAATHVWLVSAGNVTRATKELNF